MSTPGHHRATALVVVNYGSHDLLAANFGWVPPNGQPDAGTHMIVVDNVKTLDESTAMDDLARSRGWELIRCPTNVGFGRAANLGFRRAWDLGLSVGLLVNPDIMVTGEHVQRLSEELHRHPRSLVSPLVIGPDGVPWARMGSVDLDRGRVWTDANVETAPWLSGACLCAGRDLWTELDGFDDDYFMYWEDVDLSVRVAEAGGQLVLRDDIVVRHAIGGTQGDRAAGKSPLYLYYNCRNRLIFAAKHLGPRARFGWLLGTPADVRRVLSRGLPRSRLTKVRDAFGPALAGVLAGLPWLLRRRAGQRGMEGSTADQGRPSPRPRVGLDAE